MIIIAEKQMRHDSYGLMQRFNDVTKFKKAENKASNHVFGKRIFSRCDD